MWKDFWSKHTVPTVDVLQDRKRSRFWGASGHLSAWKFYRLGQWRGLMEAVHITIQQGAEWLLVSQLISSWITYVPSTAQVHLGTNHTLNILLHQFKTHFTKSQVCPICCYKVKKTNHPLICQCTETRVSVLPKPVSIPLLGTCSYSGTCLYSSTCSYYIPVPIYFPEGLFRMVTLYKEIKKHVCLSITML